VGALEREGVKYVFGLPGNPSALYDSLYDSQIEPILVRHEASGAFMAFAYSKLTRHPGVCFGSPGPGVANMISGILEAYSGCQPLIALGSSVSTEVEGKGAFQETPQIEMLRPITKWSYKVPSADMASWAMRRAFHLARNGKPGPVYIDVPFNVGQMKTEENIYTASEFLRLRPSIESVKETYKMIVRAENPIIVAGGGAYMSGCGKELLDFAEKLNVPIFTTPSGRGTVPESHPLAVGLVGLYRTKVGKKIFEEADLVISLGSRNEEFQTASWRYYPDDANFIQVDIDPNEMGRNFVPTLSIVSDVKIFISELLQRLQSTSVTLNISSRMKELFETKEAYLREVHDECMGSSTVKSKRVVYEANKVFGDNTVLVNENGSQDLWSYYYPYYRVLDFDCCIAPAEQTCMGLGVAGAIGAKLAAPNREVICITGDGAFQMAMKELPTAVQYETPVTWIVLNNYSLGWIKLHQWANKERYIAVDFEAQPDFVGIAEANKCYGQRVEKAGDIHDALVNARKANNEGLPAVLDFVVDPMDFPEGFKEFHPDIFH
jgi:acetolactate synthase-1/2/3 large subunit